MPEWREREFTIQWFDLPSETYSEPTVKGWILGPLGVHDDVLGGWTITHLKTGYSIRKHLQNLAAAKRMAERLAPLDWNFRSPSSRKIQLMRSDVLKITGTR